MCMISLPSVLYPLCTVLYTVHIVTVHWHHYQATLRLIDTIVHCIALIPIRIKQAAYEAESGRCGEKKLYKYLKAHDDLDAVLDLYTAVVEGKEALPLRPGIIPLSTVFTHTLLLNYTRIYSYTITSV
jgi:hypothetical protein